MKKGNKASSYYSACALSDGSAYNIFCEKHGKIIKKADYENLVHLIQQRFAKYAVLYPRFHLLIIRIRSCITNLFL